MLVRLAPADTAAIGRAKALAVAMEKGRGGAVINRLSDNGLAPAQDLSGRLAGYSGPHRCGVMLRASERTAMGIGRPISAPLLLLSFALFAATAAPQARGSQFVQGDLYLLSNSLYAGGRGIVRIDPLTGGNSLLTNIANSSRSTFTYDAFRGRLIYSDSRATGGIVAVDAAGTSTDLAPTVASPRLLAAGVGGILYLVDANSPFTLRYLDSDNVVHDVLDATGTAPFVVASADLFDEMIYDPATNALLFLTGTSRGVPPPCATAGRTCAVKLPLTSSWTQVAGAEQFTDVDVSPTGEVVVGSGLAPSGKVLVVVDTNSDSSEPRMQLLDASPMTLSLFASNGTSMYPAGGCAAGTYSSARGEAVILDYAASCLRGFGYGSSGTGTIFSTNLSGFLSRMVEIRPAMPTGVVPQIPASGLKLDPVTPNPIASTTLVRFSVPAAGYVRVTIHDLSGRLVRLLAERSVAAGPQSLRWDGRDDRGHSVPQGAYFLRLEANGAFAVQRIVVAR